jgi:hypothetical protein
VLAALVALVTFGSCSPGSKHDATTTTTTVATNSSAAASPTTAPPPTATAAGGVDALTVAPPGSGTGYSRDLFVQWIDANHDGCDTRCEVLKRQRQPALPGLPNGGWLSPYDGYTTPNSSELDIDHVVPLKEAWLSGASTWDAATRTAFANDVDSPELLAVTAATNRSKGDKDPAQWQPPARGDWCTYAQGWVAVKAKWHLTADPAEIAALRNMLAGCPS